MARTARFFTVLGLAFVALVVVTLMSNAVAFGVNIPGMLSVAFAAVFWAAIIAGGVWLALQVTECHINASTQGRRHVDAAGTLRPR